MEAKINFSALKHTRGLHMTDLEKTSALKTLPIRFPRCGTLLT